MTTDLNRRRLIAGLPTLAAGVTMTNAVEASNPAPRDETAPGRTPGGWSAVTYMPLAAQRQLAANKRDVDAKPYAPFFDPRLSVPTAAARGLQNGPIAARDALAPSEAGLNRLFDPAHLGAENGYAVLEGSTAYVQSRWVMPGVTTEMFRWWFTWHPVERERYMLWYPHAHVENSVADPRRLQDASLRYEDRLYGNPNHVKEFVGAGLLDVVIRFMDPARLGFDPKALEREGFTASASGLIGPTQAGDLINSMMVHLARDTPDGLELASRYWIGAHPALRRFEGTDKTAAVMAKMGFDDQVAEATAYELSVHDMTEFNHLARILPDLHARFA